MKITPFIIKEMSNLPNSVWNEKIDKFLIGEENPEETVFNWWVVDESPTEEEQFAAHAESLGEDLATFMGW